MCNINGEEVRYYPHKKQTVIKMAKEGNIDILCCDPREQRCDCKKCYTIYFEKSDLVDIPQDFLDENNINFKSFFS